MLLWCCTTSCPTAGRIGVLVRELTAALRRLRRRPRPHRCRSCRSSTRTSPSGSGSGCSGEVLEEQLAYWRGRWPGAPRRWSCRPTGRAPRPSYRGARRRGDAARRPRGGLRGPRPSAEGHPLHGPAGRLRALLCRLTGQEDMVVGSPVANRSRLEIEPLIGCFVNTLAAARGARRRSRRSASCCGAGAATALGPTPTGPALREAGRGAAAGARPQPHAALPGPVRLQNAPVQER